MWPSIPCTISWSPQTAGDEASAARRVMTHADVAVAHRDRADRALRVRDVCDAVLDDGGKLDQGAEPARPHDTEWRPHADVVVCLRALRIGAVLSPTAASGGQYRRSTWDRTEQEANGTLAVADLLGGRHERPVGAGASRVPLRWRSLRAERSPMVARAPRTRRFVSPSTTVTCTAVGRWWDHGPGRRPVIVGAGSSPSWMSAVGQPRDASRSRRATPPRRGARRASSRLLGHSLRRRAACSSVPSRSSRISSREAGHDHALAEVAEPRARGAHRSRARARKAPGSATRRRVGSGKPPPKRGLTSVTCSSPPGSRKHWTFAGPMIASASATRAPKSTELCVLRRHALDRFAALRLDHRARIAARQRESRSQKTSNREFLARGTRPEPSNRRPSSAERTRAPSRSRRDECGAEPKPLRAFTSTG